MHRSYNLLLVLFFALVSNFCIAQVIGNLKEKYPIIPTPQDINYGDSDVEFKTIFIAKSDFENEGNQLKAFFQEKGINTSQEGLNIQIFKEELLVDNSMEAYKLTIDTGIKIWATTENGAYYAIKTLQQIFRQQNDGGVLPKLEITDWPAFKIRGFMHDTGRNFQSVSQLKEQIEVLSQYKYNVFHWHLTDDPGWRLESKIYPQLQFESATSRGKGKFYTQEDFKDILAFCKARHITVIPEFDIPGHSRAFRSAMGFESMKDVKAFPVLLDLFDELFSLASAEDMPYIHIGTDEVRNSEEYVSKDFILEIMNRIKKNNRELIVWKEGIEIKEDSTSINQLWAQHEPRKGHRFIDSRANYINHLDPFAGMSRLYFQQPCRQPKGDALALGGILCAWPDNNVADERDILKQNPIYPSMVFYADAIWKGRVDNKLEYWAKLPPIDTKEFQEFKSFENKVIVHRDLFFKGKEFPYVKQTDILWNVIGPFKNEGDVSLKFPVEDSLVTSYNVDGKLYEWSEPVVGGTIHFKHFFGFPALSDENTGTYYAYTEIYSPNDRVQDFWIGFQGWSRSGGRRGGPFPDQGQWHTTNPKIWVNDFEIIAPVWKQPNLESKTDEIPFIDEDYFYRAPTKIKLKKGWNKILLKIPQNKNSWKWMFTCVPISITKNGAREAEELRFSTNFKNNGYAQTYSDHYYERKASFENTEDTDNEIIFLGNSITEGGDWKKLFPNQNVVNRGISGDITDGILLRLKEITSSKPSKVFLLVGTNDLARGKNIPSVIDGIHKIIEQILLDSKNTKIFLQSILPVNPNVGTEFTGHKNNQHDIVKANMELQTLAKSLNIKYIDLHKVMQNSQGQLRAKFTNDGLHLSKKGYLKWKRSIKEHVK